MEFTQIKNQKLFIRCLIILKEFIDIPNAIENYKNITNTEFKLTRKEINNIESIYNEKYNSLSFENIIKKMEKMENYILKKYDQRIL